MKLTLSSEELAVLFTHISLMKKSIKKGFKKTYKGDWEEKYTDYLSVIKVLEDLMKNEEIEQDFYDISLAAEKFTMLHSFINFYVNELNKKENNKDKLKHETIKLMAILESIQMKTNKLAAS
ncbi:MAG TPA: hypothetical protein GX497_03465 [Bacillus bacterium]|nr:hypothetical protein [Bacillus sp. (in: firmicutes)]